MPGAVTDSALPVRLANLGVTKNPRIPWYVFAAGAAQYRAGQDAEAIKLLEESIRVHPAWAGHGQNYVMLAMACQRLGRKDEARKWLAQAKAWLDEANQALDDDEFGFSTSNYWPNWLSVLVLLPEAEKIVTDSGS